METVFSEIDAKIALYKQIILDKIKTGRDEGVDGVEFARYSGIVEGLQMAEEVIHHLEDDGK